jgi:hypothetical protein
MIRQVAAHLADVGDYADAVPAQLVGRADTGQQEQLRRVDRAAADEDLLAAADQPGTSGLTLDLDAGHGPVLGEDAAHERSLEDFKIGPAEGRAQIGTGRAPAQSAVDGRLRDVQPLLPVSVVVGCHGESGLLTAAQEGVIELVRGGAPADVQRAGRLWVVDVRPSAQARAPAT